jgi:hypothetical protein
MHVNGPSSRPRRTNELAKSFKVTAQAM